MVMQFVNYGGLIGSAAAGAGKTLASLLIANIGFAGEITEKHDKIIIFVPSKLVDQLKANMKWARRKIHFPADVFFFKDYKPKERITLAQSNKPGVYVMGYGFLSTKETEETLEHLKPSLIIADEAHKIAGEVRSSQESRTLPEEQPLDSGVSHVRHHDEQGTPRDPRLR